MLGEDSPAPTSAFAWTRLQGTGGGYFCQGTSQDSYQFSLGSPALEILGLRHEADGGGIIKRQTSRCKSESLSFGLAWKRYAHKLTGRIPSHIGSLTPSTACCQELWSITTVRELSHILSSSQYLKYDALAPKSCAFGNVQLNIIVISDFDFLSVSFNFFPWNHIVSYKY